MKLTFVLLSCLCAGVSILAKPSQYSNYVSQIGDTTSSVSSSTSSSTDQFVPSYDESPYNQVSSSTDGMTGAATSATSGAGGAAASASSKAGGAAASASSTAGKIYKKVPSYNKVTSSVGSTANSAAGPVSSVPGMYNNVQGVVPYQGVISSVGSTVSSASGPISSASGTYNNVQGMTSSVGPAVAVATGTPSTFLGGFSPSAFLNGFSPSFGQVSSMPNEALGGLGSVSGLDLPSTSFVNGDVPFEQVGEVENAVPISKLGDVSSPANGVANNLQGTVENISPSTEELTGLNSAPQSTLDGLTPTLVQAADAPTSLTGEVPIGSIV